MTGLSDYAALKVLNFWAGQVPMIALPSVWMALMTAVDTDAGTGGTEVTGGSYARVQVGGTIAAAASFTTSSTTITMGSSNPGWVVPGMNVFDSSKTPAPGANVGTVQSYVGTTLTLTAASSITSQGTTDNLVFSAFSPSTGSAPSSITNGAAITFPTATLSWGTVVAFELRDALTSGNLLLWDWLGNFVWRPFTATLASPSVFTAPAHGYANGDPVVISQEYGGTFPSGGGSFTNTTVYTVAGAATDSFNIGQNATGASGSGMVRKIVQQSIPSGITASFAASSVTATGA